MASKFFYCGSGTVILVGVLLVVIGLVVQLIAFPAILKHTVKKNLVLGRKSDGVTLNDFAHDWLYSKYDVKIQYWIWNYTNPLELVDRGVAPDAYEVGPYSYRQVNDYNFTSDSWIDNGAYFEYIEKSTYFFDGPSSCPTCNPDRDFVRIPDPVFFGFMQQLQQLLPLLSGALGSDVSGLLGLLTIPMFGFKVEPIVSVRVSDILFNTYKSPVLIMLEDIYKLLSPTSPYAALLGLIIDTVASQAVALNTNNNTIANTFWYTIDTGKNDYYDVGKMMKIRPPTGGPANTTLPQQWWNGVNASECPNMKNAVTFFGTNGDYFHPFIDKSDRLQAYVEDICRSVNFVYDSEVSITDDVKAYRYTLDVNAFNYDKGYSENCGFCRQQPWAMYGHDTNATCLPTGLLDMTGCKGGPIVASQPHFLQADKSVLQWFPRMKPDQQMHQTTLDVEPTTGTVLRAAKRLQINVAAGGFPGTVFRLVPNGTWPIAWVNNSYMADTKTLNDVKNDLVIPRRVVRLVSYIAGVGLGTLLIVVGVGALILRSVHEKSKSPRSLALITGKTTNQMRNGFGDDDDTNSTVRRRF